MDDVVVRPNSRSRYSDKETGEPLISGISRVGKFVLEAIQKVDAVLADIERAGGTISGYK